MLKDSIVADVLMIGEGGAGFRAAIAAREKGARVLLLSKGPLGAALQAIGLYRERIIARWQAWLIIPGLLLLNNPDIEIISTLGAVLMCIGYIPLGARLLRRER